MRDEGAIALLFVVLAVLTVGFFLLARPHGAAPPAAGAAAAQAPAGGETAQFWQAVQEQAPAFELLDEKCVACGAAFQVPNATKSNRFGGVATDVMMLALAPNPSGKGEPDLAQQKFLKLWTPCPQCGATYQALDFPNMKSEAMLSALKAWDLAKLCPALDAKPQAEWTADEKVYAHYLTLKQAGLPASELGFAALSGAYAANLETALGMKRRIPGAAFYALAALHFDQALAEEQTLTGAAWAATAMTQGELQRLLGHGDAAAKWYGEARRAYEALKGQPEAPGAQQAQLDSALGVLGQLEKLQQAGAASLERAELPDARTPPIGWYLDTVLPAINGDIAYYRQAFNGPLPLGELEGLIAQCIEQGPESVLGAAQAP